MKVTNGCHVPHNVAEHGYDGSGQAVSATVRLKLTDEDVNDKS